MNQEKIWQDFITLPEEAQQQAADFITFLQTRCAQIPRRRHSGPTGLAQEAFVGMWSDRTDLVDSSQWVRDIRVAEWK